MASKKAGRLAGLAALAGLAYMANEKGKGTKDTAAENNRIADARAAREEEKGPASKPSDEAKKPFKDAMFEKEPGPYLTDDKAMYEREPGFETKTTPAKVASASSPASKPAQTQRFAPSGSPVLSSGAGSGGPRIVGLGRSSGRGGPEAGEEAAYKSAKEAQALKDFSAKRPGIVARMREKDKEMAASRRNADDDGKSMVDRQNAGAKRAGLSVDDYYTSGKKTIDEQDGTFKRGGKVKKMASGGMASKRGDGIALRGKTRGKIY